MKLNIRNKLLGAFAVLLALVTAASAIAFSAVNNLSTDVRSEAYLTLVERAVWELRFGLPNYMGGELDGRTKIRADSPRWLEQVTANLEKYRAKGTSQAEERLVKEFRENFVAYTDARPTYFDLVDAGKIDEAKHFRATRTNPPAAQMVVKLGALVEMQQSLAASQSRLFGSLVLFGLIASLVLGGVFAVLMSNGLARPLRVLAGQARRIAEGDLREVTAVAKDDRGDEIGELNRSFATMGAQLQAALTSLHEVTHALDTAVAELSASSQQQTEDLNRQAAALQEAQVTAQEIKQTSVAAAEKAAYVLEATERADAVGRSGEKALEQSAGGMSEVRSVAQQIADEIRALDERARQLGLVTDSVKDLADQSNMLALNAAIEAVRSGEYGKGFAVVAREIRSLADQSIQSTNRAREILQDVGNSIRVAVSITETGAVKMESGLQQIRASGDHMRELSGIIKENSAAARQIAAAVGQQAAGLGQIFSAVTDLSQMMDETVKRLHSTNETMRTVKSVSAKISEIVNGYRV